MMVQTLQNWACDCSVPLPHRAAVRQLHPSGGCQARSPSPAARRVTRGVTQQAAALTVLLQVQRSKRLSQLLAQLAAHPCCCCCCEDPADILPTCCNQSPAHLRAPSLAGCLPSRGISQRHGATAPSHCQQLWGALPTHSAIFTGPFGPKHHLWQADSSAVLPSPAPGRSWQEKQ